MKVYKGIWKYMKVYRIYRNNHPLSLALPTLSPFPSLHFPLSLAPFQGELFFPGGLRPPDPPLGRTGRASGNNMFSRFCVFHF